MGRAIRNPLARGFYTVPEAARLIRVGSTQKIYGWLKGYPGREIGPLLARDYMPIRDFQELSFLDLMEIRFVEHFREHGVKVTSLRLAAQRLRQEFDTEHPFALQQVIVVADKSDVMVVEDVLRASAEEVRDMKLRSLLTRNYVMYETIKRGLLPGVKFDARSRLASSWKPEPHQFPRIVVDPRIAYGKPAGPSRVPTGVLYDAWLAENENADAVAHWFDVPTPEIMEAVKFEKFLNQRPQAQAA